MPDPITLHTLRRNLRIHWWGHHGVRHWARVRSNARTIAQHVEGVDTAVTDWFAILHDALRHDEHDDPGHGGRSMAWLRKLHGETRLGLTARQFHTLLIAIEHHSSKTPPRCVTMAACWNADRLDIGRVGVDLGLRYLCPEALPPKAIIHQLDSAARREHHKLQRLP